MKAPKQTKEQIQELRDRMFNGHHDAQYPTGDLIGVCDVALDALKRCEELEKEVERLKEIEWMYNDLRK